MRPFDKVIGYEKVKEDCERDHFLSAYEAKDYGLIDKVIEKNSL